VLASSLVPLVTVAIGCELWQNSTLSLILSIMILPAISLVSRDVFLTPPTQLKASLALGATGWETGARFFFALPQAN
jgi:ABC-type phosphate transport system permease subunit